MPDGLRVAGPPPRHRRPPMPAAAPPIFVISLADSLDRRKGIAENLSSLGLAFEFFDAVDGRAGAPALRDAERWRNDGREVAVHYGRRLNSMELACYLSHLRLIRRCLESGLETALVLEDDMCAGADLPALLSELCSAPRPWELVRLHQVRFGGGAREVAALLGGRYVLARPRARVLLSAGGYLVSRQGMRRLASWLSDIRMPIDIALDRFWESGLRRYSVLPSPMRQQARCKTIMHSAQRDAERLSGALRYVASFRRRLAAARYVLRRFPEFF